MPPAIDLTRSALQFPQLKTRETPRQQRAIERVNVILEATSEVLCQHPPQALSTTIIAEHANIPVSSIYRYFPALNDVLRELYWQSASQLRCRLYAAPLDTEALPGWRDRLRQALRIQREYLLAHPHYRSLLLFFMATRGGLAVEDAEHDELVQFLSKRWSDGQDGFYGGDAVRVANTVVQISLSMEDLIAAQPSAAAVRAYSNELLQVLENYLQHYLVD